MEKKKMSGVIIKKPYFHNLKERMTDSKKTPNGKVDIKLTRRRISVILW